MLNAFWKLFPKLCQRNPPESNVATYNNCAELTLVVEFWAMSSYRLPLSCESSTWSDCHCNVGRHGCVTLRKGPHRFIYTVMITIAHWCLYAETRSLLWHSCECCNNIPSLLTPLLVSTWLSLAEYSSCAKCGNWNSLGKLLRHWIKTTSPFQL